MSEIFGIANWKLIPGRCKRSRFIKHFVDSVCADRFHCSRGPTFRSSNCNLWGSWCVAKSIQKLAQAVGASDQ